MVRFLLPILLITPLITTVNSKAYAADHEDQVSEKYLGSLGKGRFKHIPRILREGDWLLSPRVFFKTTATYLLWKNNYSQFFGRFIDPIYEKNTPVWIKNEGLAHLYKMTEKKGFLNYVFIKKTFAMFNGDIDDQLNLLIDVLNPVYNLVFDVRENLERTTKIIARDYEIESPSPLEKILIDLLKEIEPRLPENNRAAFFDVLYKLHLEKIESIKQRDRNLSNEDLRRIEFRKGGYLMTLYALSNSRNYQPEELDTFFILGTLLQTADDFNNINEDVEQEIETLTTRKLIVPEEQWIIRDRIMGRLYSYVKKYKYDVDEVKTFQDIVDKLLTNATENYDRAMKERP